MGKALKQEDEGKTSGSLTKMNSKSGDRSSSSQDGATASKPSTAKSNGNTTSAINELSEILEWDHESKSLVSRPAVPNVLLDPWTVSFIKKAAHSKPS